MIQKNNKSNKYKQNNKNDYRLKYFKSLKSQKFTKNLCYFSARIQRNGVS